MCSFKIHVETSSSMWWYLWGGAIGRWLGHEGRVLTNEISALREHLFFPLADLSSPTRDQTCVSFITKVESFGPSGKPLVESLLDSRELPRPSTTWGQRVWELSPHWTPDLPAPRSWTFQPSLPTEIGICCLSHPVYGIVLAALTD